MEKSKTRNSNLELLRIISMFLIVAHHYAIHGFNLEKINYISFNKYFIDILSLGGKFGVSCFVLISGYFMINSKFSFKKIWKIIGEVFFYSFGMLVLFSTILEPINKINIKRIVTCLFPISYSAYWFVTCFVMLMIISPYLNKFIHRLSKIELRNFIITMIGLWSIYKTFTNSKLAFSEFGWFIVLYCISAYIRLYFNFDNKKLHTNKKVLFLSMFLLILSTIVLNFLGKITGLTFFSKHSMYFGNLYSIFILTLSVSSFIYFCNRNTFNSNFINNIAPCTFGVYLIHDNYLFRSYLWEKILRNMDYYSSNYLVIHAVVSLILIYIICTIIDYARIKLLEPLWMKVYELPEKMIKSSNRITKLMESIDEK